MKNAGLVQGQEAFDRCQEESAEIGIPQNAAQNNDLLAAMADMGIDMAWLGISDKGSRFNFKQLKTVHRRW